MASKSSTKQDSGEATRAKMSGSIVTWPLKTRKRVLVPLRTPLAIVVLRKVQNRAELEQHFHDISRYLLYINGDVKLSVLSIEHFISFSFATEEVKGVNYFPSPVNDLEI